MASRMMKERHRQNIPALALEQSLDQEHFRFMDRRDLVPCRVRLVGKPPGHQRYDCGPFAVIQHGTGKDPRGVAEANGLTAAPRLIVDGQICPVGMQTNPRFLSSNTEVPTK